MNEICKVCRQTLYQNLHTHTLHPFDPMPERVGSKDGKDDILCGICQKALLESKYSDIPPLVCGHYFSLHQAEIKDLKLRLEKAVFKIETIKAYLMDDKYFASNEDVVYFIEDLLKEIRK